MFSFFDYDLRLLLGCYSSRNMRQRERERERERNRKGWKEAELERGAEEERE